MVAEKTKQVDFLVLGSGIAGLRAAITLANAGKVLILNKGEFAESTTRQAYSGVAAAIGEDDEVALHHQDTLRAGDGLCREEAVRVLVDEGPQEIRQLMDWGGHVEGKKPCLVLDRESPKRVSPVLRAQGEPIGVEILRILAAKARSTRAIETRSNVLAVELLMEDGRCTGLMYLDEKTGAFKRVSANAVLLATGGMGQIYSETTNPAPASGDGVSLAFRAGALLSDLEFIQFHPTVLYARGAPRLALASSLREHGAKLRNLELDRFMSHYHECGELAPSDVISRSVIMEMQRLRSDFVYLDLTGLRPELIKSRFPRLYAVCLEHNIDITTDLLLARPAAHYSMGGVATSLYGATTLAGLYAAGEASTSGVHGANRLANNSLLEGLVFGHRAATGMIEQTGPAKFPFAPPRSASSSRSGPADSPHLSTASGTGEQLKKTIKEVQQLMWEKVGVIRSGKDLSTALRKLESISLPRPSHASRQYYEARSILEAARLVTRCAALREESRGAHYRTDFPLKNEAVPAQHSYISRESSGYLK
ncbi:MAG: L-aspartate oxidase [Terriglobia bacterium]